MVNWEPTPLSLTWKPVITKKPMVLKVWPPDQQHHHYLET